MNNNELKEAVKSIRELQELLDLYTNAEGFQSLASKRADQLLRTLRERELI